MSIVTLTTVGFGDYSPASWRGRCIGLFWVALGVVVTGNWVNCMSTFIFERKKSDSSISKEFLVEFLDRDQDNKLNREQHHLFWLILRGAVDEDTLDQLNMAFDKVADKREQVSCEYMLTAVDDDEPAGLVDEEFELMSAASPEVLFTKPVLQDFGSRQTLPGQVPHEGESGVGFQPQLARSPPAPAQATSARAPPPAALQSQQLELADDFEDPQLSPATPKVGGVNHGLQAAHARSSGRSSPANTCVYLQSGACVPLRRRQPPAKSHGLGKDRSGCFVAMSAGSDVLHHSRGFCQPCPYARGPGGCPDQEFCKKCHFLH